MDRFVKLRAALGKYKYVIAVVLLGVVLMLLPSGGGQARQAAEEAGTESRAAVQAEMEALLSSFDDVGRLRLMLAADPATGRYTGAVVVCEGGGNAAVRLQVTQAVSALTGLSSDKITVVKGRP